MNHSVPRAWRLIVEAWNPLTSWVIGLSDRELVGTPLPAMETAAGMPGMSIRASGDSVNVHAAYQPRSRVHKDLCSRRALETENWVSSA